MVLPILMWSKLVSLTAQQWHEPDLLLAALVASGLCLSLGGRRLRGAIYVEGVLYEKAYYRSRNRCFDICFLYNQLNQEK